MNGYVVCDCEEVSPIVQFFVKLKINCKVAVFGFAFNAAYCLNCTSDE